MYINYNGKILDADTSIVPAQNRGLRYGDGLFETIKLKHNKLLFSKEHFTRLFSGMELLQLNLPKFLDANSLQKQILELAKKNDLQSARVRLNFFRGNGGLYDAANHTANYVIEAINLPEDDALLNNNGLDLCIYQNAKKSVDVFSNLKSNNFLPYVMGALYAKQQKCNDAIILNSNNSIADTTIANIFYIKNGIFYTPSLQQGCVAGIVRQYLLKEIQAQGFSVNETQVTVEDIMAADEVFLTNSIYNIRWVKSIEDKSYGLNLTQQLVQKLIMQKAELYW
jgi:branched-chain amino acid aminotransferase